MTQVAVLRTAPLQPLLTLAIPTYNRSAKLAELLEGLLFQPISDGAVELIVSDNCSTDDTPATLESFRTRGLRFRYIRNEINIGADANFLQCFEQATGKYVWLMGDDDVLVPGALPQFASLLRQGEIASGESLLDFDLAYLSTFSFAGEYDPGVQIRRRYPFAPFAEVIREGAYFLHRVHGLIGFISSIVVNKNRLLARGKSPVSLLQSNLAHLAWILPSVRSNGRILYVSQPLIGARTHNSAGWGPCQVFGVNLARVAGQCLKAEPQLTSALLNGVLRFWLPQTIMDMRLGKHPDLIQENCALLLKPVFGRNWRYWVFIYPVAVLPLRVARLACRLLVLINKVTRSSQVFLRHLFRRDEPLLPA